jgi:hypothetical protein
MQSKKRKREQSRIKIASHNAETASSEKSKTKESEKRDHKKEKKVNFKSTHKSKQKRFIICVYEIK